MGQRSDLDAVLAAAFEAAQRKTTDEGRKEDQGDRFERLIQAAFEADPEMGFDKVWFWKDYPGRKGGTDLGVDLVAQDAESGEHIAIQCKFWRYRNITLQAINAFLAASGRAWCARRVLVHTAPGIDGHGWTQIREADPRCDVMGLAELRQMGVDWWSLADASGSASPGTAIQHPPRQRVTTALRRARQILNSRRRRSVVFYQVLLVSVALLIAAVSEGDAGGIVLLGSIAAFLALLRIRDFWNSGSYQRRPQHARSRRRSEIPVPAFSASAQSQQLGSAPDQTSPSLQAPASQEPAHSSVLPPEPPSPPSLPPPPLATSPSQSPPLAAILDSQTEAELREARPTTPTDVVDLAGRHFGMLREEVVSRAEKVFGPGKADRSEDDLSRLWNAIVDEQTASREPASLAATPIEAAVQTGSVEDLLADLTEEQQLAVTSSASPLCVIAGAGSGKTRVLTRRIAYQAATGAVDPQHVLAVTFTRRAAGELRKRLRQLGLYDAVAAGTFHASALAMLRRYWEAKGESYPVILQSRVALLGDLRPDWSPKKLRNVDAKISWASARMITPEEYSEAIAAAGGRGSDEGHEVAAVYRDYVNAKQERRCIDFDDMLDLARRVLTDDPGFASDQHRRQRHLLVDEFQDVNPLQFKLLEAWLGPESTLVVVGDPRQAIFGWNGAEPELLNQLHFHLAGLTRIRLSTNFRSTPEICVAAAQILGVRPQPAVQPNGEPPLVRELLGFGVPDDLATYEASEIAKAVLAAHQTGEPWGAQVILARTNPQLDPIRDALDRAGIPVRSRIEQTLMQIPEVQEFLLDYEEADCLSELVDDLARKVATEDAVEVWGHLLEFARDALALDSASTVRDLVDALQSDDGLMPIEDGVDLSTIHRAKGLEWPIVHLVGAENGYLPDYRNRMGERRKEERRLLYVAASRAERQLHISWCRLRERAGGIHRKRDPSPWIKDLPTTGQ